MRRINLLPPEIEQRRRQRRAAAGLVFAVIAVVALLVLLFLYRQAELNQQRDRLERAQAEVSELEAERRTLQEFADLEATLKAKQQRLAQVMAGDIAWSRLLIELSMIIPGDSWLTSFSGTGGLTAPAPAQPGQAPRLGTLNFAATTFDFPGVAKWITRLQEMKSLQNIWVPSAAKADLAGRNVVNYSSTADLSSAAASNRFQGTPQ